MLDDEQREVVLLLFEDFRKETQEISRKQRAEQDRHRKRLADDPWQQQEDELHGQR
ncbi:MAG: hypothetical protein IIC62_07565, partial [Proteobacteria bacterium]|nr:hypothetical protein [Pseudomonadota bacterium]